MKKFLIFLGIVFCILICSGCTLDHLTNMQRQRKEEYELKATALAKEYIKNKYGFNAIVIDAECTSSNLARITVHNYAFVKMNYNGKTFYTKAIDLDKSGGIEGDTYQNDQIKEDIIKELTEIFNQKPEYLYSYLDIKPLEQKEYIYDYYDGNNLKKIIPTVSALFVNNNSFNEEAFAKVEDLYSEKDSNDYKHKFFFGYNFKNQDLYKQYMKESHGIVNDVPTIYINEYIDSKWDNGNVKMNLVRVNYTNDEEDIIFSSSDGNGNITSITNYTKEVLSESELDDLFKNNTRKPKVLINSFKFVNQKVDDLYIKKGSLGNYKTLRTYYRCIDNKMNNTRSYYYDMKTKDNYFYTQIFSYGCAELYLTIVSYD